MYRPRILTFLDHYLPGFRAGGPIRTVANMVEQLSDYFQFNIVACDRDAGDLNAYREININRWNSVGQSKVFYRSPGMSGWHALKRDLESNSYDMIYLGGLFSGPSSFGPLIAMQLGLIEKRPALLAPRGELSPGALSIRSSKKRAFLNLSRVAGLYDGVSWHSSNPDEAEQVAKNLHVPLDKIFIAPDLSGTSKAALLPTSRGPQEPLRVVFLSRISPKKNLSSSLDILKGVRHPVNFSIYGPKEDLAYWNQCESKIRHLPSHISANYYGEVGPDDVEKLLSGFDLFLFPTLGENYGHVIREALSSGLPILISDRTPWRQIQAKGAGADLPLDDLSQFAQWIDEFAALGLTEREKMREAARKLGSDLITAAANLEANRAMLAAVIGKGPVAGAKHSEDV